MYNKSLVLDQLKYLGMLDIIRIRREGFPIHFTFSNFILKYKSLIKNKKSELFSVQVSRIMFELDIPQSEWQLGKSKIFLRTKAYEPLEDSREHIINTKALVIQKNWKRYVQQKSYINVRGAALKIQHAYRGWKQRIKFLRIRRAAVVIQSRLRGVFAREVIIYIKICS